MRRRSRLRVVWFTLAAAVIALLGGDALYWHFVTQQLDTGFREWIAAQRDAGWTLHASPPRLGGWPLAATLTVSDVDLSGGALDFPGGVGWRAAQLTLRVNLLHPQQLNAIPSGDQRLRLGYAPSIPFTARRMQADVPLRPDRPPHQVILHATDLRAGKDAGTVTIGTLQAQLDSQPAGQPKPALGFAIDATPLSLPPRYRWALGPTIASLRLDGTLLGPFPVAPDVATRAMDWRNGGGALDLRRVALHWGPLALSGEASLGLDQQLQPDGHANVRVSGYDGTLDAMSEAGVLSPAAALAAKALLSLMAQPGGKGKSPEVDVPLRLQNSTLFMHHMPLLRLPVLDWPQS